MYTILACTYLQLHVEVPQPPKGIFQEVFSTIHLTCTVRCTFVSSLSTPPGRFPDDVLTPVTLKQPATFQILLASICQSVHLLPRIRCTPERIGTTCVTELRLGAGAGLAGLGTITSEGIKLRLVSQQC